MADVLSLMVKAVNSLPEQERDALLRELLGGRLQGGVQMPLAAGLPDVARPGLRLGELIESGTLADVRMEREVGGRLQTVPVRLPAAQYERLKQWCQVHGFTMAVVVRGLVARFLDDQEKRSDGEPAA
ncbi:MAG TPA: hypothetical protein VKG45_05370 [Actinomycetes bacterium]|nr:hypothetical protein [Actinomycetes bacterium]